MIIDIVELPRRLVQFKHGIIDSRGMYSMPTPSIERYHGYWEPDDTEFIGVGSKHELITGKDALFRYKFIEPTKFGIAEYFVLTGSPIDIRRPLSNRNVQLYCPFFSLTDTNTMLTRKFIIWNGVFELLHYETEDSITDAPVEAVTANEMKNILRYLNASKGDRFDCGLNSLLDTLNAYPECKNVLITELKSSNADIEQLLKLGSNFKAYTSILVNEEPYYWADVTDIFRHVDIPMTCETIAPVRKCTLLAHFIYGSATLYELKHLFGLNYDTHAFQRWFNTNLLSDDTIISIDKPDSSLFQILSYVENLPYSEFELVVDGNGLYNIKLYNQYDPTMMIKCPKELDEPVYQLVRMLRSVFRNSVHISVVRSWGEEVYITIKRSNDKVLKFYFDMLSLIIGSRSIVRDYNGHMFA